MQTGMAGVHIIVWAMGAMALTIIIGLARTPYRRKPDLGGAMESDDEYADFRRSHREVT